MNQENKTTFYVLVGVIAAQVLTVVGLMWLAYAVLKGVPVSPKIYWWVVSCIGLAWVIGTLFAPAQQYLVKSGLLAEYKQYLKQRK